MFSQAAPAGKENKSSWPFQSEGKQTFHSPSSLLGTPLCHGLCKPQSKKRPNITRWPSFNTVLVRPFENTTFMGVHVYIHMHTYQKATNSLISSGEDKPYAVLIEETPLPTDREGKGGQNKAFLPGSEVDNCC